MSPALYASYQQWLDDNPGKTDRLEGIINQVIAEYRSAMTANAAPVPSSNKAIHQSCVRHAQTTIIFELKKEIGLTPSESENASAIRADVFPSQYKGDALQSFFMTSSKSDSILSGVLNLFVP